MKIKRINWNVLNDIITDIIAYAFVGSLSIIGTLIFIATVIFVIVLTILLFTLIIKLF